MKIEEIRSMSTEDLFEQAAKLRESQFRLRFKLALGNQDTVKQIRADRTDLARVKTELRAREIAQDTEAGERPASLRGSRDERRKKTARALRGTAAKR